MVKSELVKLIGPTKFVAFNYSTYTIGSGLDTALVIDFAFDKDDKVYRWRKRMVGTSERANKEEPAWSYLNEYKL